MAILIGVNEAGYGPNLGPLVVSATAWEIADCDDSSNPQSAIRNPQSFPDLYKLLRRAVTRVPDGTRVAIADSKALYKPGIGLAQLERGVLSALYIADRQCRALSWSNLVESLDADANRRQRELAWHEEFNCDLPYAVDDVAITTASGLLARAMDSVGVRLKCIRARLVFPGEFNELVETFGNKAAALSEVTLRLVREVVDGERGAGDRRQETGDREQGTGDRRQEESVSLAQSLLPSTQSPCLVLCDKHGGRNHYAALVQQHFPESWVETLHESRAESWYRTAGAAPLEFCFRMNGEAFLPAALASMTAKYLRELSMRAFNQFWSARVPNLRPTAGYPIDAKRFRVEIASERRRLGIADRLLWRNR